MLDPPELELCVIVNCLTWVLKTELWSSHSLLSDPYSPIQGSASCPVALRKGFQGLLLAPFPAILIL